MRATAFLLAARTLQTRPRRTLVLLLGYGLGVAVMIALLAVGDALLLQAQDRDVVAGGDLVLVPAGLDPEVLKTGAVTAMFLAIPNARFLVRQLLLGPRYAEAVAAASPEMIDKLAYVRIRGEVHAARASGTLPSAARAVHSALAIADPGWQDREDDRAWLEPAPQDLLAGIDRFHEPPSGPDGRTWAEWWYFNFAGPDGLYGYVSLIADRERRVHVSVTVHGPDGRVLRFGETHTGTILPFAGPVIAAGPHRIELRDGVYRVRIAPMGPTPDLFTADLLVAPTPGWFLPPFEQQSGTFRSGYVVPALRAAVTGTIVLGRQAHRIDGIGYHDHNWGVWQDVTWEWGTTSSPDYALLTGLVRHATVREQEMLVTVYGHAGGRAGVLGVLRGSAPVASDWKPGPRVGTIRLRVPGRLRYRAANDAGDRLDVEIVADSIVATPLDVGASGAAAREAADTRSARAVFLQIRGRYSVTGTVGGRSVRFSSPGFAETFVPIQGTP